MGKALQGFVVMVFCATLLFSKENAQCVLQVLGMYLTPDKKQ